MPTFKYSAKNQESQTVAGKIVADSKPAVIQELRKRNLVIVKIEEVKGLGAQSTILKSKKVKPEELVIFTRQLATMVDAGIPILQGINALEEQTTHVGFKKVLMTIEADIRHGNSLSIAFGRHPHVFSTLFINLVKVGETGGVLSSVLERVALYMEKSLRLTCKVKSALIYPAVVISMAIK